MMTPNHAAQYPSRQSPANRSVLSIRLKRCVARPLVTSIVLCCSAAYFSPAHGGIDGEEGQYGYVPNAIAQGGKGGDGAGSGGAGGGAAGSSLQGPSEHGFGSSPGKGGGPITYPDRSGAGGEGAGSGGKGRGGGGGGISSGGGGGSGTSLTPWPGNGGGGGGGGGTGLIRSSGGELTTIRGGNGGAGGVALPRPDQAQHHGGGGGGGGGIGVILTGGEFSLAGAYRVDGGNGGDGGFGYGGGGGGAGAHAVAFREGVFISHGVLTGGRGGNGGDSFKVLSTSNDADYKRNYAGNAGSGGKGITVSLAHFINYGVVNGGTGGTGGGIIDQHFSAWAGGRGGNGGDGGLIESNSTAVNHGSIIGGTGGAGGIQTNVSTLPNEGGTGGAGVVVSNSTFINEVTAVVNGGTGGVGGVAGSDGHGPHGSGGVGILASNAFIVQKGTVAGGFNGDGITRGGNAITFTGGRNTLELHASSVMTGNVVGTGHDTLILGGAEAAAFDMSSVGAGMQYSGFDSFKKQGSSVWTLAGSTTDRHSWLVTEGQLIATSTAALGRGTVTLDASEDATVGLTIKASEEWRLSDAGLVLNNGARLTNHAQLQGITETSYARGVVVSDVGGATVINYGAIKGLLHLSGVNFWDGGTVVNYNLIEGVGNGYGVVVSQQSGAVYNDAGATIRNGVTLDAGGMVVNEGIIDYSLESNDRQKGVLINGSAGEVINSGTIISQSLGVVLSEGGHVHNRGGIIEADVAIYSGAAVDIINERESVLRGKTIAIENIVSRTALTNRGAIYGHVALSMVAANSVTLEGGSLITGDLNIGSDVRSELILAGDEDDVIGVYSESVNGRTYFNGALRKQGSGSWLLDTALITASTMVEEGEMTLSAAHVANIVGVSKGAVLALDNAAITHQHEATIEGTLQGRGSLSGLTTISGALRPEGAPDARLEFGSALILTETASTFLEVKPEEGHTSLSALSLTYGGTLSITIQGVLNSENDQWILFEAGTTLGGFSAITLGGAYSFSLFEDDGGDLWQGSGGGYAWSFSESSGILIAEAIPEPSFWLLGGVGILLLFQGKRACNSCLAFRGCRRRSSAFASTGAPCASRSQLPPGNASLSRRTPGVVERLQKAFQISVKSRRRIFAAAAGVAFYRRNPLAESSGRPILPFFLTKHGFSRRTSLPHPPRRRRHGDHVDGRRHPAQSLLRRALPVALRSCFQRSQPIRGSRGAGD